MKDETCDWNEKCSNCSHKKYMHTFGEGEQVEGCRSIDGINFCDCDGFFGDTHD